VVFDWQQLMAFSALKYLSILVDFHFPGVKFSSSQFLEFAEFLKLNRLSLKLKTTTLDFKKVVPIKQSLVVNASLNPS
jgi:hypothetical protein